MLTEKGVMIQTF